MDLRTGSLAIGLAVLAACSTPAPAVRPATVYTEAPLPSEVSQRRVVAARVVELPRLPARGFVAASDSRVAFFSFGGRLLFELDGYTLAGDRDSYGVWLSRSGPGSGYLRVNFRRHRLMPVRARTARVAMYDEGPELSLPDPPGQRFNGMLVGHWGNAFPSPGGTAILGQWSGECEVPIAYWIAAGTEPRPVVDRDGSTESIALGWTPDDRALVHLTHGYCGGAGTPPGVYAYSAPMQGELLFATRRFTSVKPWSLRNY